MPVIDGEKVACWPCIRGHRVGSCNHAADRPMMRVRRPGRPLTSCPHLADAKCDCPSRAASLVTTPDATSPGALATTSTATTSVASPVLFGSWTTTAPAPAPVTAVSDVTHYPEDQLYPLSHQFGGPTLSLPDLDLLSPARGTAASSTINDAALSHWTVPLVEGTPAGQPSDSFLTLSHSNREAELGGSAFLANQQAGDWWSSSSVYLPEFTSALPDHVFSPSGLGASLEEDEEEEYRLMRGT